MCFILYKTVQDDLQLLPQKHEHSATERLFLHFKEPTKMTARTNNDLFIYEKELTYQYIVARIREVVCSLPRIRFLQLS